MLVYTSNTRPDCRMVMVPPCEPDVDPAKDLCALATFQMKIRDTIDFGVNFSDWLAQNGGAQISDAVFAKASTSPSNPTIAGQAFSPAGKCVVVLSAPEGAEVGDAFYLDITVTVSATVVAQPGDVAIPARTLVRRINVVLVNG